MHATLIGENHHPIATKKWRYSVTATDAKGKPLNGTVEIEFTFQGTVVGRDNPFKHQIKNGHETELVTFPAASVGQPISVQAIVKTSLGTKTLDWSVVAVKK